jgi:hypothetical protein
MNRRQLNVSYAAGLLSDTEFVILRKRLGKRIQREYTVPRFSLDRIAPEACKELFRMDKTDIPRVIALLEMPPKFRLKDRNSATSEEVFCLVLRRLTYPCRLNDLQGLFPRHHTTLSLLFNMGISWLYDRCHVLVSNLQQPFFTKERMQTYAAVVAQKTGQFARKMRIFGFIDGTFKSTCRPTKDQRIVYNGKDRAHGLKYQALTAPDGLILHLAGPFEGARHDAFTFLESQLEDMLRDKMTALGRTYRMYGDPAYTLSDYLLTPFRRTNNRDEIDFNQIMAGVRIAVEWSFGKVLQLFSFNDYSKNLKIDLQPVAKLYVISVVLANIHTCLYQSQIGTKFELMAPTVEEYLSF